MASLRHPLVVLELNEITWDLIDPLMRRGVLPNFQRLVAEGTRGEPWAREAPEHLDPWVTWTTLYTGVPQELHGLTMLEQDRETVDAPRVWDYLRDAGLSIGLFGSANSWPPAEVDGFWIPGPFSRDFSTYPKELEPIQALNVGLTRGHTAGAGKVSLKQLLPKLLPMGLQPATALRLGSAFATMKLRPQTRWKMIALQPILNLDFFAKLYRTYRPDFSTFHSNHVAYYMHRFWRAMQPEAFEVPPSEEEKAVYGGCIEHGYRVADELLGRLRALTGPSANLVVLSSCGQQPATGGRYSDDQRHGHIGLRLKIDELLKQLGIADRVRYSNLMAPQWKVDFPDGALLEETAARLRSVRNVTRNAPVLAVNIEGSSICVGPYRNQEVTDTLEIAAAGQARQIPARALLERHAEVAKSGRHHPKGVLLMHGPDIRQGIDLAECDNLDIAPTLLEIAGKQAPDLMPGHVLRDALRLAAPERQLLSV